MNPGLCKKAIGKSNPYGTELNLERIKKCIKDIPVPDSSTSEVDTNNKFS